MMKITFKGTISDDFLTFTPYEATVTMTEVEEKDYNGITHTYYRVSDIERLFPMWDFEK